jgi:hypothetical protein
MCLSQFYSSISKNSRAELGLPVGEGLETGVGLRVGEGEDVGVGVRVGVIVG